MRDHHALGARRTAARELQEREVGGLHVHVDPVGQIDGPAARSSTVRALCTGEVGRASAGTTNCFDAFVVSSIEASEACTMCATVS